MGTVIGPISQDDWVNLVNSRGNLRFWKKTDSAKYSRAIEKTEAFYATKLREYAEVAA